jgi:hypothetical protein
MSALAKAKTVGGWVLHVGIGGLMILAGTGKVFGFAAPEVVEALQKGGLGEQIRLIGAGELLTAVLLLVPRTSSLGVLLTSGFWGGVICFHMAHGESYLFPSALLVLTWVGAYLRNPATFSSFFRPAAKAREESREAAVV